MTNLKKDEKNCMVLSAGLDFNKFNFDDCTDDTGWKTLDAKYNCQSYHRNGWCQNGRAGPRWKSYWSWKAGINGKDARSACCACGKQTNLDTDSTYTYKQNTWTAKLSGWTRTGNFARGFDTDTGSGKAVVEGLTPGRMYMYKIYQFWDGVVPSGTCLNSYTANRKSMGCCQTKPSFDGGGWLDGPKVTASNRVVANNFGKIMFVFKPGLATDEHGILHHHNARLSGIRIDEAGAT